MYAEVAGCAGAVFIWCGAHSALLLLLVLLHWLTTSSSRWAAFCEMEEVLIVTASDCGGLPGDLWDVPYDFYNVWFHLKFGEVNLLNEGQAEMPQSEELWFFFCVGKCWSVSRECSRGQYITASVVRPQWDWIEGYACVFSCPSFSGVVGYACGW